MSIDSRTSRTTLWGVTLLLAIGAPFVIYPTLLMKIFCVALFACAFNLLLGYGGLLSFGHAAFFGSAGYTCAHLTKIHHLTPELGVLGGVVIASVLGAAFGVLAIRRSGIYFAMITLALAQLVFFMAVQAPITGGEDGLQGVPRGHLFGLLDLRDNLTMYYFVLAVFLLGFGLVWRVVRSPFGLVLEAIRENEVRATSLGYRVDLHKLLAFTISAGVAGLAGATKALVFQIASLAEVHWHTSGDVILTTLLGGLGTLLGPIVGAAFLVSLQDLLAEHVGAWSTVVTGLIFVLCVLTFRSGIVGTLTVLWPQWVRRMKRKSATTCDSPPLKASAGL